MKKYVRWTGIVFALPFVLFIILCILIYIPPIQNFLVGTATRYASEATGMQISIQRISLKFPLDLVVHQTLVIDKQDTILSAENLTAEVQFWPLIRQQVELDGLKLEHARINTAGLIEGIKLQGDLGELFVSSHGVSLNPETAVVNKFILSDTHLSLSMADTTATDTTASAPLYWKIDLQEVDLNNVSFAMDLPLDTFKMALSLDKASLRDGVVDLHQAAYSARSFDIENGNISIDLDNRTPATDGLDPMHIRITDWDTGIDSLRYAGNNIYAHLRKFNLKERSGLEVISSEGKLSSDDKTLYVPSLKIRTKESDIELNASMDWNVTDINKDGMIRARLMANIGKGDLMKAMADLPENLKESYPATPLSIKAGIDGNLKEIRLTAFSVKMLHIFHAEATGKITNPMDSLQRKGNLDLNLETGNLFFLRSLTGELSLPENMKMEAAARLDGSRMEADLHADIPKGKSRISAKGGYDLKDEAYQMSLNIDSLNLHDFMPNDSLFYLSAALDAEGKGTDFFSPHTQAHLTGGVSQLEYGSQKYGGITLNGSLSNALATIEAGIDNHLMHASANLAASLHPHRIKADLNAELKRIDLFEMGITAQELNPSLRLESHAETDMKMHHKLIASLKDIQIHTAKQSFRTKDLHAGVELAADSLRCFANAGDLTFLFHSGTGLEKLMKDFDRLSAEAAKEWENKRIDQKFLKELLPSANLKVFSEADNPVANMLSSMNHIKYDRLRVNIGTSPLTGINGNLDLYGLRTDSLRLDTIYFRAEQDSTDLFFHSGVKALASKRQEAFDISINGNIGSTDASMNIGYMNAKGEKGVDLGLVAKLQEHGITLQLSPENPTLVYRPFHANKGNYVYLSDKGKIFADLKLYDENHTGLSLYSTPDSLTLQDLTLGLHHINIGEFRRIVPYMPDISGSINAEAHYVQNTPTDMTVAMDVSVEQLAYNKMQIGNWGMNGVYMPDENGAHKIDGFVTLNDEEIISLAGSYTASEGERPDDLKATMEFNHFPLNSVNAFIPDRMASLGGDIDGKMKVTGSTDRPQLNGTIGLDDVTLSIPQASLNLRFDNRPVTVSDSQILFDRFSIFTKGKTPFTIDGTVNMSDLAAMKLDLKMEAQNFELINAKRTKESLVHGKLYVDFNSTLKGTPDDLKMRGNMNILGKSDFTYILKDSPLTVEDRLGETVTFVDFSDTTDNAARREVERLSLGGLDLMMTMHIDEAVQARVDLNDNGSNYMLLEGGGDLSFQYTPDGNMLLNGRYSLISGEMKYEIPIIPLKTFHIKEGSYIEWTGNMMNPNMNIKATERVRASVASGSDSESTRMVNFDVGVALTNRLEDLGLAFTLEAPDDGTMQNELASKSDEEKNKLAVTMLVTGMYMSENNATGKGLDTNSMLNSFLQGEINKVAGNALKTVDINFGMETTDENNDGTSRTDYKVQFAKRFWNNRFQVVIGGKISTGNDVQQEDESFIDNISLEYRLDNSGTRYIRLFHDKNYESVLDGEVIETGAGVVLRKKVSRLGELFIFRTKKKKKEKDETPETKQSTEATENKSQTRGVTSTENEETK